METHNIDSIIKKVIDGSMNFYDMEANKAKERIWKQVKFQQQKHPRLILLRFLVAACILLFISTSIISIAYIKTNKSIKTLAELNSALKNNSTVNDQNTLNIKEPVTASNIKSTDTIYIERKVIVSKPVNIIKYVIDTVYISKIAYVKKEQTQKLFTGNENNITIDSNFQTHTNNYETKILISNNEIIKQGKRKKLQFKFGGNKDQIDNGTLAFSAKL
jgi:hypothetical protein